MSLIPGKLYRLHPDYWLRDQRNPGIHLGVTGTDTIGMYVSNAKHNTYEYLTFCFMLVGGTMCAIVAEGVITPEISL